MKARHYRIANTNQTVSYYEVENKNLLYYDSTSNGLFSAVYGL